MGTHVLVVDDSSVARKILIRAFPRDWVVEIAQAADGAQALEAYRARRPDVIFLDLNMPVMDGYQVLEALRSETNVPPIVVLTGDIQPIAEERVRAAGAVAFLKKPIAEGVLAGLLDAHGLR